MMGGAVGLASLRLMPTTLQPEGAPNGLLLFGLLLLTAVLLQILSNFANDYGDFVKGTDNDDRIGPERTLQSGALTPAKMRVAMGLLGLLAFAAGSAALVLRFGDALWSWEFGLFLGLGLLAIWAAIAYTVGDRAYGYRALGDVFVFLFFGLVAVVGSCFLICGFVPAMAWLMAGAVGFFSAAVLNLNNMRDLESDTAAGKRTLPQLLGADAARTYHAAILLAGWACIIAAFLLHPTDRKINLIWFAAGLLFVPHLRKVLGNTDPTELDPELKKVALGTFLAAILVLGSSLVWKALILWP